MRRHPWSPRDCTLQARPERIKLSHKPAPSSVGSRAQQQPCEGPCLPHVHVACTKPTPWITLFFWHTTLKWIILIADHWSKGNKKNALHPALHKSQDSVGNFPSTVNYALGKFGGELLMHYSVRFNAINKEMDRRITAGHPVRPSSIFTHENTNITQSSN